MNIDEMEWQFTGDDQWIFGPKVRGLVRMVAELYFDEAYEGRGGGWRWMTHVGNKVCGRAGSFREAVSEVEHHVSKAEAP
jgi:hypothetical protein